MIHFRPPDTSFTEATAYPSDAMTRQNMTSHRDEGVARRKKQPRSRRRVDVDTLPDAMASAHPSVLSSSDKAVLPVNSALAVVTG